MKIAKLSALVLTLAAASQFTACDGKSPQKGAEQQAPAVQADPAVPVAAEPSAPVEPQAPATAAQLPGTAPSGSTPFARDVERICNSRALAGAENMPAYDAKIVIATWLGDNIESAEGRKLLADVATLEGAAKAQAFEKAAAETLSGKPCPIAAEWK